MNSLNFSRRALALCGILAMPAGCGPGAPGIVANSAITQNVIHGGSRVTPEWKGDLIYTSNYTNVFIYTPGGVSVGTLDDPSIQSGLCSDPKGNVFTLTTNKSEVESTIYKYRHGGKKPIAKLKDAGIAFGCAVDPTSGNLAVTNWRDHHHRYTTIAIYPSGTGPPTYYSNKIFGAYWYCGYDRDGNLYTTAVVPGQQYAALVGLAKGSKTIKEIALDRNLFLDTGRFYPSVQWDGRHITVSNLPDPRKAIFEVYRLSISGTSATVVGTTTLTGTGGNIHLGQIEMKYSTLVAPYLYAHQSTSEARVGYWPYPRGGKPERFFSVAASGSSKTLLGLTISAPPKH